MRYEGALRSPIYDLCRQTVTVYHACYNPFRVTRCVIHGAYFERKTVQTVDKSGGKSCDEFLLVIPNKNARRAAPALFNGIPGVCCNAGIALWRVLGKKSQPANSGAASSRPTAPVWLL